MRKPVVLAVEDEGWRQERIAKAVGSRARVVYIGDGSRVLGFLERTVPDLVLLDHDLEGQGGLAYRSGTHIADWLARHPRLSGDIHTVVVTTHNDERRPYLVETLRTAGYAVLCVPCGELESKHLTSILDELIEELADE
jgi:CheY-like chemotaxis protein